MKKVLLLVFLLELQFTASSVFADPILYDDFEDGFIDPNLWVTYTNSGGSSVIEENGYIRIYGGGSGTRIAWIKTTLDFRSFDIATVSFDLEWWKNYTGGYIYTRLYLADDETDVHICTFNSNLASSQHGAGNYTVWIDSIDGVAKLYQGSDLIKEYIDVSSLSKIKLKFYTYSNQIYGGSQSAVMHVFKVDYTTGEKDIIDNTERLFIPAGQEYTLDGFHTYTDEVDIRGTLHVRSYDGTGTKGTLHLHAPLINVEGIIDGEGRGFGIAQGPGAPWAAGGGGGAYGGAGGSGVRGSGGVPYGTQDIGSIEMGSGGAKNSTGCAECPTYGGKPGGGAITLECDSLLVNGTVNADGGGGEWVAGGPGGGGSGGGVLLIANSITIAGEISASGGQGASSSNHAGGGGGGGRIKIFYGDEINIGSGLVSVVGGPKGSGSGATAGEEGTIYIEQSTVVRSLSLIAPNGGEILVAGYLYPIRWTSEGDIGNVLIKYSTDNGGGWNDVDTVPNTGSYNWLVPLVDSNQCLVRIGDAINPDVSDTSDDVFTIQPPPAGSIVAWGWNDYGQSNAPVGDDFVAVEGGTYHSLTLKSDGSLTAWGGNEWGQCDVPSGNEFVDIASGVLFNVVLKSDGSLVSWGRDGVGQVSNTPSGNDFIAVDAGSAHGLALRSDGSLAAWGINAQGQCNVPAGNDFVAIAAGAHHSFAWKGNGTIVGWGWNTYGQCDVPLGVDLVDIDAGYGYSVGLKSDGSLIAWGNNSESQCDVPAGSNFVDISAGWNFSLAILSDGSLTAWGGNEYGQCNVPYGSGFIAIGAATHHGLALVGEPTTPPVADADGPYSIFVGDMLTLDANDSTDDDNDIVSYMWDLDDNNSFETDAGGQAIFDVNYTYLDSLGLLVNNTYNIHLKVTDSEGQSDVNDSTLTIVPKPALVVAVDIKPTSCPNPLNVKSSGVLPVAILGSEDVNVVDIDATSIELAGVSAVRHSYEDVAGPVSDTNDCNCTEDGPDGLLDLTLKFKTQEIVEELLKTRGQLVDGEQLVLELTGVLFGERPIEGTDCVLIKGKVPKGLAAKIVDTNKDGVIDLHDFAILANQWLESYDVE